MSDPNASFVPPAESKYNIQTKEIVIDLGKPTPEAFDELKELGKQIEINVLSEFRVSLSIAFDFVADSRSVQQSITLESRTRCPSTSLRPRMTSS